MSRAAKVSIACGAILAWVACARATSALVPAALHQHWVLALFLLTVTIACASLGLWLSEYVIGWALNQRALVAVSILPEGLIQRTLLDPETLKSANDTLSAEDLVRAHNDAD